jgi:hypothetical protein
MENEKVKQLLAVTEGLIEAMKLSISQGKDGVWRFSSYKEFARKYNQIIAELRGSFSYVPALDAYDLDKIPSPLDTLAMKQKEYFDSILANLLILRGFLANSGEVRVSEVNNIRDFIQSNLRKAIFENPQEELEVQDSLEQLFIGRGLNKGIDYDRETGRVRISVKEVVPDFILMKLDLAIEVKLLKSTAKVKAVVDEINADIRAYGKRYQNILFLIYDLGYIRDTSEFKNDLDNATNIQLVIVKH